MRNLSILIFCLLAWCAVNGQSETEILIAEGIELHDLGKYKKAVSKYDKALKESPNDIVALAEKALTLTAMKDFEYCFQVCEKAIETHPNSSYLDNVFTCYANALDMSGQPEKAIKIYERGIDKFPSYYHLYFNKGVTEAGINFMDESLLSFEMAVKCNPNHASSHNAISAVQSDNGANVPSLLALCRFFILEPTSERALNNLPRIDYLMNGNVTKNGKKGSTITIDVESLDESDKNEIRENDFSSTELILSFSGLMNLGLEELKLSERAKFLTNFNAIINSLEETQVGQKGFYWEYYAPYFIEMHEKEFLEAFSYMVFATDPDKDSKKWIKQNEDVLDSFYKWDSNYKWPTK